MKRVYTNLLIWIPLCGFSIFGILWSLLPNDDLIEVASNAAMGAAVACMFRWARPAFRHMRPRVGEAYGLVMVGIFAFGLASVIQRSNITLLRWLERPEWLVASPASAVTATLMAIVAVLFLVAPDAESGRINIVGYIWIGTATFMAMVMTAVYFVGG